jgi:hypothetical protein
MDELSIIELLTQQRESVLGIWRNLLTVAIALIAYFGAMQNRVDKYVVYVLLVLFPLFAASNINAICNNFKIREDLKILLSKCNSDSPFIQSLIPTQNTQYLNFGFHIAIDITVVMTILVLSGVLKSSNKQIN